MGWVEFFLLLLLYDHEGERDWTRILGGSAMAFGTSLFQPAQYCIFAEWVRVSTSGKREVGAT